MNAPVASGTLESALGLDDAKRLAQSFHLSGETVLAALLDRAAQLLSFLRPGTSLPAPAEPGPRYLATVRRAVRSRAGRGAPEAFEKARLSFLAQATAADQRRLDHALYLGANPAEALGTIPPEALGLSDPAYLAAARTEPLPPPSGLGTLVLIAKLTRHCNLRCVYCTDWREGPGNQMSPATQALMVRRAAEDASASSVRFIWHGGEPGLLGARKMLGFLWLQSRLRREGQIITNSIQTNGVALSPQVVALWQLFDFKVSVSLDGPRALHDRQRRTLRGGPSFDAVVEGIGQLREAGMFTGALIVVTPEIAALPIDRLVSDLVAAGVHSAGFLPVRPDAGTGEGPYLPPEEFSRFLARLFDLLRHRPDLRFDARELDGIYAAWQRQPAGFCELNGPCLGDYFGIEPDGTVRHCDKFLGTPDHLLGNLAEHGFPEIRTGPQMERLRAREVERRRRLDGCRWYGHCKGWCPHESHIALLRGSASGCCGLAPIFDHFDNVAAGQPLHP